MKKFKKTYIEITNVCNLSCNFCPKTSRAGQFMGIDLFKKILHQIKGYSEYLYFHVMGEPLLHADISGFLDLSAEYGYKVNITTNGTLIDKIGASIMHKPSLRQINFSLHSLCANLDKYQSDSYLDKIFKFIDESQGQKPILISLRLWNLKEGENNQENEYILKRIEGHFDLPYKIRNELTPVRGIKISQNIFLNQASVFEWPEAAKRDIGSKGFCHGLRDQVAILVDGTVVPCCLDSEGTIALGNINEKDFAEIIGSKRATLLYEGFSRREAVENLCRKCGYRKRFSIKI